MPITALGSLFINDYLDSEVEVEDSFVSSLLELDDSFVSDFEDLVFDDELVLVASM